MILVIKTKTQEKRSVSFNMFGDFAMNIKLKYYIIKGQDIAETET